MDLELDRTDTYILHIKGSTVQAYRVQYSTVYIISTVQYSLHYQYSKGMDMDGPLHIVGMRIEQDGNGLGKTITYRLGAGQDRQLHMKGR